jgi:putative transposase
MPKPKFIRKRNRLPFRELYQGGYWYFVTICVQDKKQILSHIVEAMPSSPYLQESKTPQPQKTIIGEYVEKAWLDGLKFYDDIILDEFVIMPNHFHAIIGFNNYKNNLGNTIKAFKKKTLFYIKQDEIICGNEIGVVGGNGAVGDVGIASTLIQKYNTIWQKSFHDHIIRDQEDLDRIREYIFYNPLNWHLDSLNPKSKIFKK